MDGDGREDEEANVRGGVGEVEEGLDEGRDRAHPRPERPEMEPAGVSRGGEEDAVGVSAGAEAEAGETARAKGEGGFAGTRRGEEGEDEERQRGGGRGEKVGTRGRLFVMTRVPAPSRSRRSARTSTLGTPPRAPREAPRGRRRRPTARRGVAPRSSRRALALVTKAHFR